MTVTTVCFFVLCKRHWINRVRPGRGGGRTRGIPRRGAGRPRHGHCFLINLSLSLSGSLSLSLSEAGYIISVVLGGETLQLPVHVPEGTCGLRLKTADRTLNVLTRNTHVYSVYIPFALPFGNSPGLNVGKRLEKALDIGLF